MDELGQPDEALGWCASVCIVTAIVLVVVAEASVVFTVVTVLFLSGTAFTWVRMRRRTRLREPDGPIRLPGPLTPTRLAATRKQLRWMSWFFAAFAVAYVIAVLVAVINGGEVVHYLALMFACFGCVLGIRGVTTGLPPTSEG